MIPAPWGARGQATDIKIHAEQILKIKRNLMNIK